MLITSFIPFYLFHNCEQMFPLFATFTQLTRRRWIFEKKKIFYMTSDYFVKNYDQANSQIKQRRKFWPKNIVLYHGWLRIHIKAIKLAPAAFKRMFKGMVLCFWHHRHLYCSVFFCLEFMYIHYHATITSYDIFLMTELCPH